ncbi:MAG: hypothetical protein WCG09_09230 [Halobacteriota archaeon]
MSRTTPPVAIELRKEHHVLPRSQRQTALPRSMLSPDPKLLSEMSKNALTSARTFDLNVHVQKLEEIYEEVTSR